MMSIENKWNRSISKNQSVYTKTTDFTDICAIRKIQLKSFEKALDMLVMDLIEFKIKQAKEEQSSQTGTTHAIAHALTKTDIDSINSFLSGILEDSEASKKTGIQNLHGIQYNIFTDSIQLEDAYIRYTLSSLQHIPFLNTYASEKYGILPYHKTTSYLKEAPLKTNRPTLFSKLYDIPDTKFITEGTYSNATVEPGVEEKQEEVSLTVAVEEPIELNNLLVPKMKEPEPVAETLNPVDIKFLRILSDIIHRDEFRETPEYNLAIHLKEKPEDIVKIPNTIKLSVIEKHNRLVVL